MLFMCPVCILCTNPNLIDIRWAFLLHLVHFLQATTRRPDNDLLGQAQLPIGSQNTYTVPMYLQSKQS